MVHVAAINSEDVFESQAAVAEEPVQANPFASVARAMRGRWFKTIALGAILAPAFAGLGYFSGSQLYNSQAILRVFPQESNILYSTGEDSVLKIFSSFVKAEATYVASHPVMERSVQELSVMRPDLADGLTGTDMARSVNIKRSDSLIVLTTLSRDRAFASQKLEAVIASYLALKSEAEEVRTSVRLSELRSREEDLIERLAGLRMNQLETGGEFGLNALAKAHIEKIAQVDALAARKSEVAATLAALETEDVASSADTSDQEIMRATLLDRAMADLSFERAKLKSELAGLRAGYRDQTNLRFQRKVDSKTDEIAVIEQAISNRRDQIRVLGQTGALTAASNTGEDTTLAEIRFLLEKVSGQLGKARGEARDLNRRRIDLDGIETEISAAERLLEETRRALEVIRLEFGRALPGYAVVMSPPSRPIKPAEDTRKLMMATGFACGLAIALATMLVLGLRERRVRYAESLLSVKGQLPIRQVSDAPADDSHAADLLRNELQLQSLRKPRLVGTARVIAVTSLHSGGGLDCARALAESFSRARMKVLFIDADISTSNQEIEPAGWSDLLLGAGIKPRSTNGIPGLSTVGKGSDDQVGDSDVSARMVQSALKRAAKSFDVVIVSTGGMLDCLSAQFILSNADVGVCYLTPSDNYAAVLSLVEQLDSLPANGTVAVMRNARPSDPWLAVRT
ncbi:hypothetical protein KL867_05265 [Ruegeria litorea]|uniref:Uncharacterized protein n=1 Tax=Falsiruegeria litorea TaxID=1280831 RepID=A0ABS5WMU8_9RHOB|nr:hypothetical protein [Falsiruegeria litorea]MBT3140448.1 hypothetical protein [Falsiruegeria litorea]